MIRVIQSLDGTITIQAAQPEAVARAILYFKAQGYEILAQFETIAKMVKA